MGSVIHPTAVIHPSAQIGEDVSIGAFCVIGEDVTIGEGTRLEAQVNLDKHVKIGRNCQIWSGAVIGGPPQDYKFGGETSHVIIGDDNIIREFVTVHRAVGEGNVTSIGSGNMIMAYVHIGHNCAIGNSNTISSYVGLSGHAMVEDKTVLGGMVGVHQYTCIGKLAMIGGMSKVNQDVPPFMLSDGIPARVIDCNRIGLRRNGVEAHVRTTLRQAYKLLYRSDLNIPQAMERIEDELEASEELEYLLTFMRKTQSGNAGRGNERPKG